MLSVGCGYHVWMSKWPIFGCPNDRISLRKWLQLISAFLISRGFALYYEFSFHGRLSVTLIFTLWSSSSSLNKCRSSVTSRSIGIASKWCPFLLWLSCIQVLTRYGSDVSCITDVMRASLIYPTIAEAGVSLPQRFCQEKGNMAWPPGVGVMKTHHLEQLKDSYTVSHFIISCSIFVDIFNHCSWQMPFMLVY